MDGLLGLKQFHSETANLFTDEKTANARSKVVEWINEIGIAESAAKKCELLTKVQEIILGSCVQLLEEFLEHILSLAHDANMDVRKQVVGFLEQICKVKVDLLPSLITVIASLIRDRSPQVIKRVIQACGSIYKNGLQWLCQQTELSDSMAEAWSVMSLLKAQILDLIDNDNDGIRTNAIKFLEGVVVLQSPRDEDSQKKENDFSLEDVPEDRFKILKRQKLDEEALDIFEVLVQFHGASHISSVNLIACTGSLCTIAKLRPRFMGAVVEAYKSLNSNLPPTLTDSQVSSVRKSLKMQLMALLKNRGSFEFQTTIRALLLELGASQSEIQKAIPKMDKQEQIRRQKRLLESSSSGNNVSSAKRMRLTTDNGGNEAKASGEMEIDEVELEKQRQKSIRVNEKFITEQLRSTETAVELVLRFLPEMPDQASATFLTEYKPSPAASEQEQVARIARLLAEHMTDRRLGPGAAAFSKTVPMRPKAVGRPESAMQSILEEQQRKEEATKKLRENMERVKGEQELIERMKMKAKTLKLQEVTKPFAKPVKEKFLMDAVNRILQSERQCIVGGASSKRRKILTVIAATFPDKVRYFIFDFIMKDVRQRIDLAFSWLYEEYCLFQGFTRHSYVKTENRPDHAYNELLSQLITGIIDKCEFKDKIILLRRLFLEAPIIPDNAFHQLTQLAVQEEYAVHCLDLMRDLTIMRPPRKQKFVRTLLAFCVHERKYLRDRAVEHVRQLYHVNQILPNRIEEFALEWCCYLEMEVPPATMFSAEYGRPEVEITWKDELVRICLLLVLSLMSCKPEAFLDKLLQVYVNTSQDHKRTILRTIDVPIKKLGPECPYLLKYIEDFPKGTEPLILRFIYILCENTPVPNPELVRRIRDLYATKMKDVRLLIPVLGGLTKQEILNALPMLIKCNTVVVKEVFSRLLGLGDFANQSIATTPSDILIALHTLDTSACDIKQIIKATSTCLAEKEVFTQEVLIGVLQKLVEIVPLPTLLMRTVLQSLTLYPRLSNFVLSLLQRLILKQVWKQKVIWEGFLKCVQRLAPQSMPVLLQLPGQQLVAALEHCPDLRKPLQEYAESMQDEPMSGITPQIMDIISGKAVDVFVTDESGGYISVENIKKEVEDPQEVSAISTIATVSSNILPLVSSATGPAVQDIGQPLPPGEE